MKCLLLSLFILGVFLNIDPLNGIPAESVWVSQYLVSGQILSKVNCTPIKLAFGVDFTQVDDRYKPDISKLKIEYLTSNNWTVYNISSAAPLLLKNADFDKTLPLLVVIHGFMSTAQGEYIAQLANALVTTGGKNVMSLDSQSLINKPLFEYLSASTGVKVIGRAMAEFLTALTKGGFPPDNMHLVGYSLGAQIGGQTGKYYKQQNGGTKIGRISGLDPAGPCFFVSGSEVHLTKDDAKFVDIIHTSSVAGNEQPMGHVDTFPNNGECQTGCFDPICSHRRALLFYIESVLNASAFKSVQCDTWKRFADGKCQANRKNYMGYHTPKSTSGIYFLRTGASSPFSLGDEGINKEPWWKIF